MVANIWEDEMRKLLSLFAIAMIGTTASAHHFDSKAFVSPQNFMLYTLGVNELPSGDFEVVLGGGILAYSEGDIGTGGALAGLMAKLNASDNGFNAISFVVSHNACRQKATNADIIMCDLRSRAEDIELHSVVVDFRGNIVERKADVVKVYAIAVSVSKFSEETIDDDEFSGLKVNLSIESNELGFIFASKIGVVVKN